MSLEKFQATDAWKNKFKNLLVLERNPSVVRPVTETFTSRLSFELSEDLQVILEEKTIPRRVHKMPRVHDEEENKENREVYQQERIHTTTPTKSKRISTIDTTLVPEDRSEVLECTNTSFETLEEMCEKTASDPDSTLFRYLNRGSTSTLQATRAGKAVSYDEEADALQRLLDELNVEETEKRLKAQLSPNDTQLDDIEAPSRFWENTLTAETIQSISPVKMVGLLRQSTIMEECSDLSESEASSASYLSAVKTSCSSETTGCYETANETGAASEQGAVKKASINSSGASSSSELFQQRHSRQKFFTDDKEEDSLEKSLRLIDLETTVTVPEIGLDILQPYREEIPDSPESPEPEERLEPSLETPEDSLEPLKSSPESTQFTETDGSSSIIELSDDESSMGSYNILEKVENLESENVLNRSFTIKSEEAESGEEEKSLHFNDTMEEVEYMMKKGMQYMQEAKEEPSPAKSHLTPIKNTDRYRSPSPMLSSPITPKTVIAKPKPVNKYAMDIKPFPKLELFKKPQGSGLRAPTVQNKFVSSMKKQQFAHVVSPIGAYIKKTPTTPLVSTAKPPTSESSTSRAFKQLEFDSRVTPQDTASSVPTELKTHFCSLPKKAYISSEYKHIVDERTQYTIPGGPKIQRYLASSMIPAVVRHEGKVKIPANLRTSDMEPPAPRRTDDSLANLSLMSGDVSVYTIKDAQKF